MTKSKTATKTKPKRFSVPRVDGPTITGRELLLRIKALVLEEPARLDMRRWVTAFRGRRRLHSRSSTLPACGTVGCVAGWGAILLRPNDAISGRRLDDSAEDVMTAALGLECTIPLFTPDPVFDETTLHQPGSKAHARVVAKRIDTVLARYPAVAKRVIDVASVRAQLGG